MRKTDLAGGVHGSAAAGARGGCGGRCRQEGPGAQRERRARGELGSWQAGQAVSGGSGAGRWGRGDAAASERLSAPRGLRRRRVGWAGALRATRAAVPRPDAGEGSGPAECGPRGEKDAGLSGRGG